MARVTHESGNCMCVQIRSWLCKRTLPKVVNIEVGDFRKFAWRLFSSAWWLEREEVEAVKKFWTFKNPIRVEFITLIR